MTQFVNHVLPYWVIYLAIADNLISMAQMRVVNTDTPLANEATKKMSVPVESWAV